MFNFFKKSATTTVKTMSAAEMNAKYNPINSSDPYVQYALTGNL